MPHKRVVLDTNIWISFIIKGRLPDLVHLIFDHDLIVYSSPALITEVREVLARPKFSKYLTLPIEEYMGFISELTQSFMAESAFQDCPDPKDNFLFDLAFQAECSSVVTGDKKLLEIKRIQTVDIITLSDFQKMFL